MAKIAFVGNIANISYLLARELIKRGHRVDLYGGENEFHTNKLHNRSLAKKYGLPYERTLRRYLVRLGRSKYDIEVRSFEDRLVHAKYSIPIYHGSDIRLGAKKIEYPCFYTTKDLEKYLDPLQRAMWL